MTADPLIAKDETLEALVSEPKGSEGTEKGGTGGGIKAKEDDAVQVTDFATKSAGGSPGGKETPSGRASPPSRVETPVDKQSWDNFIDQYSSGSVHHLTFPVVRPSRSNSQSHPEPNDATSSKPLRQTASPLNLRNRQSSSEKLPSPVYSSPDDDDFKDQHRITSSVGQANQDPSIPNIAPENLNQKDQRGTSAVRTDLDPPQSLTREHMDELGEEQKDADAIEAEADADAEDSSREDGQGGSNKGKASSATRRKRPRPVLDAELGSQREAHSMSSSSNENDIQIAPSSRASGSRRSRPTMPHRRSYRSTGSSLRELDILPIDSMLAESATGSSANASHPEESYDYSKDRDRVREFFTKHGYMPAPQQAPDAMRRRLRVIRRLGLETPDDLHRTTLDRFTRLAVGIFKTKRALVSIIGRERQIFLSEIGMGADSTSFEDAFCCHTIIGSGDSCMVVPDASNDWRFAKNPLVDDGKGIIQFYAGAPLRVGKGPKSAIIGSMCIIDDKPRHDFDEEGKRLLSDLAECAVSELELLYNQQATVEAAKLHQISVDFLRRSLKHRPMERAGRSRPSKAGDTMTTSNTRSTSSESTGKRNSGADHKQSEEDVDIFDEACQVIRLALDAHAVAIVDLTQFHMFYPSYQTSTMGGSTSGGRSRGFGGVSASHSRAQTPKAGPSARSYNTSASIGEGGEDAEPYQKAPDGRAARKTYAVVDPMSSGRAPQVLFVPSDGTATGRRSDNVPKSDADNSLPILGYSCEEDNFAFNFSSSPAGRKIVCDFIARNVKGRTVWYSRDDSEGIAESITHLMPPGTEASLAMPVFGYDGQVAFAVVGCWTDPLFSYPAGALQFVETIAGSLLASVMKERLHQAERAQLNFAAAASHELRTPLHQLNAAAALLRQCLQSSLVSPSHSPQTSPALTNGALDRSPRSLTKSSLARNQSMQIERDDRREASIHLEVIESNGAALGQILENIIDTLDIGRAVSTRSNGTNPAAVPLPDIPEQMYNLSDVLEGVVKDVIMQESKARRVAGEKGLEDVEILLEVMPRLRGRWVLATDPGPLSRALSKIIANACKFTDKGYIHITVQDMSRDVVLPGGYDNSIKLSQVVFDVKDTGRGMTPEFLDENILRPFAKADPFMPGAGLGLNLAQRMIQILGGKLAIKSTLGKGTLVHIELPLHLLSIDNDSDQDDMVRQDDHYAGRAYSPVRQDGIYLTGFDGGDAGLRRVGRTLLRQLKLRFCRVIENPQYASLIVVPEGRYSEDELVEMVSTARPDVEVISLLSIRQAMSTTHEISAPSHFTSSKGTSSLHDSSTRRHSDSPMAFKDQVKITYLKRPLFPSVIRRIVRAPKRREEPNEIYISDVTGGDEAREERNNPNGTSDTGLELADLEIAPSPPSEKGSNRAASVIVSDKWSSSGGTGSTGRHKRPPKDNNGDLLDGLGDNEIKANTDPAPPTGYIKDLVTSPTTSGRPQYETHHTEPTPISESLSRLSLRSLQSDQSVSSIPGPGEPVAMKVLVVEDNAVNRRIVVAMLKRTACRYAEAVDGEDAVRQFMSFEPDLVLLDINMPKKDGFQAATEMRNLEAKRGGAGKRRAKIIAVTALSQEQSKRRGMLECGIDEWRTKPVSLKTLKEDVERMRE